MKIDNYLLTTFQACPAKYMLRKAGWTARRKSAALVGGGVIHYGIAEWYRSNDLDKALDAMRAKWPEGMSQSDDWRTLDKWLTTLRAYVEEYPRESFNIVGAPDAPMVECSFLHHTGMYLACENAECDAFAIGNIDNADEAGKCICCNQPLEPIEYGGIFDTLIEFGGTRYILEHKSSSVFPQDENKRDHFWSQFKPNNQCTGYVWGSNKLSGLKVGGVMVNAIGMYKTAKPCFGRKITSRSDAAVAEWLIEIRAVCQQIRDCERRGVWPMSTPSCTMYGRCTYHDVHQLDNEIERQKLLQQDFILEEWDFMNRDADMAVKT